MRTAPSLNSGSYFLRGSCMTTPHSACLHGFGGGPVPVLGARSLLVVEQQGADIPAEWLLLLGGLLRGGAGGSSDLGIALALLHGCVGRGDRCQTNRCRGSGDGQCRDIAQFHLFSPYMGDIA